jgi:hypothetical protein
VLAEAGAAADNTVAEPQPRNLVSKQAPESFLAFGQRQLRDALAVQIEKIENEQDQLVGSPLIHGGIETIINKSERIKELKSKAQESSLTAKEKKELTAEEKEFKSKRKLVQEKLIKFATRIPAFMYLTDFRENTLQDVITKLEPDLFLTVAAFSCST